MAEAAGQEGGSASLRHENSARSLGAALEAGRSSGRGLFFTASSPPTWRQMLLVLLLLLIAGLQLHMFLVLRSAASSAALTPSSPPLGSPYLSACPGGDLASCTASASAQGGQYAGIRPDDRAYWMRRLGYLQEEMEVLNRRTSMVAGEVEEVMKLLSAARDATWGQAQDAEPPPS